MGIGGGNPDSNCSDGGNAGQVSSAGLAVTFLISDIFQMLADTSLFIHVVKAQLTRYTVEPESLYRRIKMSKQ